MGRNFEARLRSLEDERLIAKTEKNYEREIEERNRRRRTELIAWTALVISIASLVINAVDKLA